MANTNLTCDQVRAEIKKISESVNNPHIQSSPVYGGGHRTMAPTGRSSAGNDKENGFMGAPNSKTGPRR